MVDRYSNGRGMGRSMLGRSMCGTCGSCENGSECKKMMAQLQKVEFAMIDTILYLDAYPCSAEALKYYHKLKDERAMLIEELSEKCNMPITSFDNISTDTWYWIDNPWPWEHSAN